jgi:hypothetical protein
MFWKDVLKECFGKILWKDILRGSGNNLPDLLYNSNKPSNAVRPGGLGGTPIKKNHPKRRKLHPYIIIRCGWHLVGTVGIYLADELVLTAQIRNRKIVGTCRFS